MEAEEKHIKGDVASCRFLPGVPALAGLFSFSPASVVNKTTKLEHCGSWVSAYKNLMARALTPIMTTKTKNVCRQNGPWKGPITSEAIV